MNKLHVSIQPHLTINHQIKTSNNNNNKIK